MTSEVKKFKYKDLGECLELVIDHRGKTPRKLGSDWVEKGIPTISAKNVNSGKLVAQDAIRYVTPEIYKKWMKVDVESGDCFLVSEGATLGECLYWDNDYPIVLGQRIFCMRTNPDVLYSRYLYAYMTSAAFQSEIIGRATGSSVPGLRQTEVLKLKVKMLPMDQQIFIGDLLYNINEKIKQNTESNQTLEQIGQAIFKSWFVDFEPVKAKIVAKQNGKNPELAAMRVISGKTEEQFKDLDESDLQQLKTTAALFPDKLVDSELGVAPNGWCVKSLSRMMSFQGGSQPPAKDFIDNPLQGYVRLVQIRDFASEAHKTYVPDTNKLRKFNEDDLLIARYGSGQQKEGYKDSLARLCRGLSGAYNVALVKVLPTNEDCLEFLKYFLNSHSFQAKIKSMGGRSVQSGFRKQDLEVIDLVVPPEELIAYFNDIGSSVWLYQKSNNKQNKALENIRDAILPKLLSGELSVKSAYKDLEVAV